MENDWFSDDSDLPIKHEYFPQKNKICQLQGPSWRRAAVAKIVKEGGNSNGGDRFSKGSGKNYTGNQSKQKAKSRGICRGICRRGFLYLITRPGYD